MDWVITTPHPAEPPALVRGIDDTDAEWRKKQRGYAPLKMPYDLENRKWTTTNKKCMAMIKDAIEPASLASMVECDSVTEYLEKIKSQFVGSSKSQLALQRHATRLIRNLGGLAVKLSDLGKPSTKSIEMCCQALSGIGRGAKSPERKELACLACCQIEHCLQNYPHLVSCLSTQRNASICDM